MRPPSSRARAYDGVTEGGMEGCSRVPHYRGTGAAVIRPFQIPGSARWRRCICSVSYPGCARCAPRHKAEQRAAHTAPRERVVARANVSSRAHSQMQRVTECAFKIGCARGRFLLLRSKHHPAPMPTIPQPWLRVRRSVFGNDFSPRACVCVCGRGQGY